MGAFLRNSQLKLSAIKMKGTHFNGPNLCLPDLRKITFSLLLLYYISVNDHEKPTEITSFDFE